MVKQAEKNTTKPYLRVIGMVLVVAFGVIAFILSEPAGRALLDTANINIPLEQARILVGVAIFIVLLMFTYVVFAIFAPKDKKSVNERDLEKERAMKQAEMKAKKKRSREINRKMAESNREKNR